MNSSDVKENSEDKEEHKITFSIREKTLLELTEEGIKLNRDNFPHYDASDFVWDFINLIENHFDVKFIERIDK
jgi:hypothetical protein